MTDVELATIKLKACEIALSNGSVIERNKFLEYAQKIVEFVLDNKQQPKPVKTTAIMT